MGDLEWTNDLVIRLMQEYSKRPELWDPSHSMYRVQSLKYETWRQLASMFDCNIGDLRKKINSLLASHRREKAKIRIGFRSSWFLYPHMSFLPSHIDCTPNDPIDVSKTVTAESKARPPVKEAAPPSSSSEPEPEPLEEDALDDAILVKVEPEHYSPRYKNSRALKRHSMHKPKLNRPVKRRVLHRGVKENRGERVREYQTSAEDSLAEALRLLRRADRTEGRKKDECDSFGEYIADSLRKHDERTQSMIKQAINNILFEQEMKRYNASQYTVVIADAIDENPLILGDETETEKD